MSNQQPPTTFNISVGTGANSTAPSVGGAFVQQTHFPAPAIGDMRQDAAGGKIEMWDGTQWIDVSPNQMTGGIGGLPTLDLDSTPEDALALAIYTTYEMEPGANLPAARAAAKDVVKTLQKLGFEVVQGNGSVKTFQQEDDFDFSDICNACGQATDEYADYMRVWEDGTAPPDRFCLFHRGYVMGQPHDRGWADNIV